MGHTTHGLALAGWYLLWLNGRWLMMREGSADVTSTAPCRRGGKACPAHG